MQIEVGKTYLDEAGNKVTIIHDTGIGVFPYVGTTSHSTRLYNNEGTNTNFMDAIHNLVKEYSPYADWPMDCPVRVRYKRCDDWVHRHFAGINQKGQPMAWDKGLTSHTSAPYHKSPWNHIERVDEIYNHEYAMQEIS
jgi:hypothetical protein